MTKKTLPRNCLSLCAVPYLCVIACPLNVRLEQISVTPEADASSEPDEPLQVLIENKERATWQTSKS